MEQKKAAALMKEYQDNKKIRFHLEAESFLICQRDVPGRQIFFPEKKPMPGWALPGWPGNQTFHPYAWPGSRNKSGFFQHLCFLPYTFPLCYGILFVKAGFWKFLQKPAIL